MCGTAVVEVEAEPKLVRTWTTKQLADHTESGEEHTLTRRDRDRQRQTESERGRVREKRGGAPPLCGGAPERETDEPAGKLQWDLRALSPPPKLSQPLFVLLFGSVRRE